MGRKWEMTMEFNEKQQKEIQTIVVHVITGYNKGGAFTDRKVTDRIPGDSLSVVNRQFVSGNGTFANRPKAVTGQRYFANDLATNGLPAYFNGTDWVSATGSVLGIGI